MNVDTACEAQINRPQSFESLQDTEVLENAFSTCSIGWLYLNNSAGFGSRTPDLRHHTPPDDNPFTTRNQSPGGASAGGTKEGDAKPSG